MNLHRDDQGLYYLNVTIGRETFTVLFDTGSDRTTVPCVGCETCGDHAAHDPNRSGIVTPGRFVTCYDEGSCLEGTWAVDDVAFEGFGRLGSWKFGCADSYSTLFRDQFEDGILGVQGSFAAAVESFSVCGDSGRIAFGFPSDPESHVWIEADDRYSFEVHGLDDLRFDPPVRAYLDTGSNYAFIPDFVRIDSFDSVSFADGVRIPVGVDQARKHNRSHIVLGSDFIDRFPKVTFQTHRVGFSFASKCDVVQKFVPFDFEFEKIVSFFVLATYAFSGFVWIVVRRRYHHASQGYRNPPETVVETDVVEKDADSVAV